MTFLSQIEMQTLTMWGREIPRIADSLGRIADALEKDIDEAIGEAVAIALEKETQDG
jgi:hypothetical protein